MRPGTIEDVADAVRTLRRDRRHAVVVGGGTLLDVADAGPPDAVRLYVDGLDEVVAHEPADLTCTVGAGMTLSALDGMLAEAGQAMPVWHPAPERATIGGLVAFGWTGLGRRLYGPLRDRVLEVRAVTGQGKTIRGGGKVVKNVTGFDLPRLFCGSLGTLGVIVEVTLKVHPRPGPLHAVVRTGEGPGELALGLAAEAERVRIPVETVLVRTHGEEWWAYVFAPGPREDAERLLAGFHAEPVDDAAGIFRRLASDPVLVPSADTVEGVRVRVAVPPARILDLAPLLTGAHRAVVDVASGVAWAAYRDGEMVAPLRSFAEAAGGSGVIVQAPDALRGELGTWGTPPGTIELQRRLKASFDPDHVLGRGRFVV